MAKAKDKPGLSKVDLTKVFLTLRHEIRSAVAKIVKPIEKRLEGVELEVFNLRVDKKTDKRNHQEVMQAIGLLQASVDGLNDKVRYQEDFPERLVQAEHDIYALKLEVHHLKDGKA